MPIYRTPLGAKLLALSVVLTRASEATTEELIRTRAPEFVRLFGPRSRAVCLAWPGSSKPSGVRTGSDSARREAILPGRK